MLKHLVTLKASALAAKRSGFTLIELLVVVVIIGILASIALPSFVGAQDKARNSSVTGNVSTVRMALEQWATDNNGSFPEEAAWTSTTVASGVGSVNYLPGGKLPKAPWCKAPQTTSTAALGANFVLAAGVASGVALGGTGGTTAAPLGVGAVIPTVASGSVVSEPSLVSHYGCLSYDYDANTQTYVLYGTGKKNKDAIIAAQVSNNGN